MTLKITIELNESELPLRSEKLSVVRHLRVTPTLDEAIRFAESHDVDVQRVMRESLEQVFAEVIKHVEKKSA